MRRQLWAGGLLLTAPRARAEDAPAWVGPMRQTHAKFTGKPGPLALFGDSITVSKAFWTPLSFAPKDLPEPVAKNLEVVKKYMNDDCWSKWRGADYGSDG